MDQELKTKWVEALRSGDYLQAPAVLYVAGSGKPKMCCLGVLEHICGTPLSVLTGFHMPAQIKNRKSPVLGFDPSNKEMALENVLANMNDNLNMTFEQIANYIEKNL